MKWWKQIFVFSVFHTTTRRIFQFLGQEGDNTRFFVCIFFGIVGTMLANSYESKRNAQNQNVSVSPAVPVTILVIPGAIAVFGLLLIEVRNLSPTGYGASVFLCNLIGMWGLCASVLALVALPKTLLKLKRDPPLRTPKHLAATGFAVVYVATFFGLLISDLTR
jgi:hypothetical protein